MKRRKKIRNRIILLLLGVLLLLCFLGIYVLFHSEKEEPVSEPEIVYYYNIDQFKKDENGLMTFTDPDYMYTTGIDVSQFQHYIDWEQVAQENLDFVMIRAGYRGAIEGLLHTDEYYEHNIQGALDNNMKVGVYWYSTSLNTEELDEEIDYLLELIEPYDISYPVVYDMEPYFQDENGGRIHVLSVQEKTDLANYFCDRLEEKGYKTMIYGNSDWLYNNLDFNRIRDREIWYAAYQSKPSMIDRFTMWQYSNRGIISGIDTDVDINIYIQKKEDKVDE